MDTEQPCSDKEKVRIACDYFLHAPPGEFNEIFNDVRMLVGNDTLLQDGCQHAFAQYNKDQFVNATLLDGLQKTLITVHNQLPEGRFYCPKAKVSFKFNHLRREVEDVKPHAIDNVPLVQSLQTAADAYMSNHYATSGVCAVFTRSEEKATQITLCIEAHGFQSQNFWNGRWRSQWSFSGTSGDVQLKGLIKVQVHYYEDGNVQLVSSKDILKNVTLSNESESAARELIAIIQEEETAYQMAVHENYQSMSDTTFKALRRQLPVTRTKFDWTKVGAYRIGQDISHKPVAK